MLSSSSSLLFPFPPPKRFYFDPIHPIPISKIRILTRGSQSKRFFRGRVGRVRVSDQKKLTELAGVDAFRGSSGSENEAEAILGDESLVLGQDLELAGFESTLNRMVIKPLRRSVLIWVFSFWFPCFPILIKGLDLIESKWLVAALFGLVILWKHDAEVLWAAMGSIVNSCLSVKLKQMLNHERPASALRSDPGMPSSHAQSIFYTAFFAVLSLFDWLGMNTFTVGIGSIILLCGSYLSWLRVSQHFHTISQVVVGAILGSLCSITWFWMWHSFVLRAFVASIWVRIIIVLGSIAFCFAFLLYVVQHWLKDER